MRDAVDGHDLPPGYEPLVDRSAYLRAGRPIRTGCIASRISRRQAMQGLLEVVRP
ncbi:MAG: hypothetical protein OXC28_05610 [Defluviicoccus sp.]|nr:hypothetical protein [Defluviicoccus sp.]